MIIDSIRPIQEPFPIGVDRSDRAMISCNYRMMIVLDAGENSTLWERTIENYLVFVGLILEGFVYIGPDITIPDGDGPYVTIINTGGTSPLLSHTDEVAKRPSMQIVCTAQDYDVAMSKAVQIRTRLSGSRIDSSLLTL